MTDEELIARWDDYVESMGSVMGEVEHMAQQMRDRIEALVNEAVLRKAAYKGVVSLLLSVQQDCIKERQRAKQLEAALKWQAEQPEAHPFMVAHALAALKGADYDG